MGKEGRPSWILFLSRGETPRTPRFRLGWQAAWQCPLFSGPPKFAKRSANLAIRTCRGKPRYVRHGQASAQCSRGCLMRLARAAVAEASRAPPAGADAASTALRGAARTVGFVSATLNPPDPVTPAGETRHQCSHIATLPRPRNTRLKTRDGFVNTPRPWAWAASDGARRSPASLGRQGRPIARWNRLDLLFPTQQLPSSGADYERCCLWMSAVI